MEPVGVNVLGSANMDLVIRVPRFAKPGETLLGGSFETCPGGKGANQAVAIGKLGGTVRFIGAVGDDLFGKSLLASLTEANVDISQVKQFRDSPTGVALITVDAKGENTILVASGANALVNPAELPLAKVLLCQLEIPIETIMAAARAHRGVFILNPAPAQPLPAELLQRVDILTPNESEFQALTGIEPDNEIAIMKGFASLKGQGVKQIVLTRGSKGVAFTNGIALTMAPAKRVEAVDTTAAGDAFSGALAMALSQDFHLTQALDFAMKVAAYSVTKKGAQASMPTMTDLTPSE